MRPRLEKIRPISNDATVTFLVSESSVLLAKKKRKLFVGKWNGYGGFREEIDKTLRDTAVRETLEESTVAIEPDRIEKMAVMTYENEKADGSTELKRVHYYFAREWAGIPSETAEMGAPEWFNKDGLPFEEMLPTDQITFPYLFQGVKLTGRARFNLAEGKLQPGSMRLRRWRI